MAGRALEFNQVPSRARFLHRTARVEDDREIAGAQVGDGMTVGMAVKIKTDLRRALKDGTEALAVNEAMGRLGVLEEGKVVEEEDRIVRRQQRKDFFKIALYLFGKDAVGGGDLCRGGRVECDAPPAGSDFMRLYAVLFQGKEFRPVFNRRAVILEGGIKSFLTVRPRGILVVVARDEDLRLLYLVEVAARHLKFRREACAGQVASYEHQVNAEAAEELRQARERRMVALVLSEKHPIERSY